MTAVESAKWVTAVRWAHGLNHARPTIRPCQDYGAVVKLKPDMVVTIVCDGAGSTTYGGRAAEIVVEYIVAEINSNPTILTHKDTESAIRNYFFEANRLLHKEAENSGVDIRQLACTICMSVGTPNWVATGRIGDAFTVLHIDGKYVAPMQSIQEGWANETTFLNANGFNNHIETAVNEGEIDFVFTASDGLGSLAITLKEEEPISVFLDSFRRVFQDERCKTDLQRRQFLRTVMSDANVMRKSGDDMAISLAVLLK